MALYLNHPIAVMVPVTIAAVGIFCALPVFWTLPTRYLAGTAAAAGIGLINSVSNLGGFAAPYITGALEDLTGSNRAGMWAVGIIMLLCAGLVVSLRGAPQATTETPRCAP